VGGILFYGPTGTGKTLMVRAIASETKSLVMDLSPSVISDKYMTKQESEKMVAMVFKAAK
jgi:ATP-dependent 26S proteasome regulatory subunit